MHFNEEQKPLSLLLCAGRVAIVEVNGRTELLRLLIGIDLK